MSRNIVIFVARSLSTTISQFAEKHAVTIFITNVITEWVLTSLENKLISAPRGRNYNSSLGISMNQWCFHHSPLCTRSRTVVIEFV